MYLDCQALLREVRKKDIKLGTATYTATQTPSHDETTQHIHFTCLYLGKSLLPVLYQLKPQDIIYMYPINETPFYALIDYFLDSILVQLKIIITRFQSKNFQQKLVNCDYKL